MNRIERHALVWPTSAGWERVGANAADDEALRATELWRAHGWPLVVRRFESFEAASVDEIAVGLPLPPAQGKRRLRFRLMRAAIARVAEPLSLEAVVPALPPAWMRAAAGLAERARDIDLQLRVFGSAAWHAITGLAYLREASDLDVLARPRDGAEVDRVIELLDAWERHESRRADGELVLPDGGAVSWREWRTGASRILVKRVDAATLEARDAVLARFDPALATT